MPPSTPFIEEFCLDVQKQISLRSQSLIFLKITKLTQKIQVSRATSSIRGLLASLNIHYNNSLNTEVQKQNET